MSGDTSPGREALLEAMRLEQARIYGQLCPEKPRELAPATVTHLHVVRDRKARTA